MLWFDNKTREITIGIYNILKGKPQHFVCSKDLFELTLLGRFSSLRKYGEEYLFHSGTHHSSLPSI